MRSGRCRNRYGAGRGSDEKTEYCNPVPAEQERGGGSGQAGEEKRAEPGGVSQAVDQWACAEKCSAAGLLLYDAGTPSNRKQFKPDRAESPCAECD